MHTCQVQGMMLHNILVLEKKRGEEISHLDKTAGDHESSAQLSLYLTFD